MADVEQRMWRQNISKDFTTANNWWVTTIQKFLTYKFSINFMIYEYRSHFKSANKIYDFNEIEFCDDKVK
jgi:hypothetical protein